jgi:hypothetical protein
MAAGNDNIMGTDCQSQNIKHELDKVYLFSSLPERLVHTFFVFQSLLEVQPNLLIPDMLDHAVKQRLLEQCSANRYDSLQK